MPRQTTLTSLKAISDINMTPLMDLTFILLIAFIITYPLIEQGVPVNLPLGNADDLNPDQTRTISVDIKGRFFLDDLEISPADLAADMNELGAAMPDITVFIRADKAIAYGKVAEVLQILHGAKIKRTALVTQPESP